MKIAVVSGASGFIGGAVSERLLKSGVKVYGIGRNIQRRKDLLAYHSFVPIQVGFEDYSKLKDLIEKADIDVFYHFAWEGGFERPALKDLDLQLKNVQASYGALLSAVELGCKRFVYAGTVNEVEIRQFLNAFDHFQTRPTCIYASAKLMSELVCRTFAQEYHIHYNSGLIPMVYGVGNRSKQLVNVVLENLLSGVSPKLIEGKNQYDLVHVEDVARAFEVIGNSGIDGKQYYVGHRTLKTFREWMEELRDVVAPDVKLLFNEYKDPLDLDYSLIDLNSLYVDTGFECREDFAVRIKENAEWFQRENMAGT